MNPGSETCSLRKRCVLCIKRVAERDLLRVAAGDLLRVAACGGCGPNGPGGPGGAEEYDDDGVLRPVEVVSHRHGSQGSTPLEPHNAGTLQGMCGRCNPCSPADMAQHAQNWTWRGEGEGRGGDHPSWRRPARAFSDTVDRPARASPGFRLPPSQHRPPNPSS